MKKNGRLVCVRASGQMWLSPRPRYWWTKDLMDIFQRTRPLCSQSVMANPDRTKSPAAARLHLGPRTPLRWKETAECRDLYVITIKGINCNYLHLIEQVSFSERAIPAGGNHVFQFGRLPCVRMLVHVPAAIQNNRQFRHDRITTGVTHWPIKGVTHSTD